MWVELRNVIQGYKIKMNVRHTEALNCDADSFGIGGKFQRSG